MGSQAAQGNTLYEKFENMMQQLGIILSFDDEVEYGDETSEFPQSSVVDETREEIDTTDVLRGRSRQRRASFNSLYDIGEDATQRSFANRPSSRSSLSRLQTGKTEDLESPVARRYRGDAKVPDSDRTQLMAQFLDVGRRLMSRMDSLKNHEPDQRPPVKESHARPAVDRSHSEGNTEVAEHTVHSSSSGSIESDDEDQSYSEVGTEFLEQMEVPREIPRTIPGAVSPGDMMRDASAFEKFREREASRGLLSQWRTRAVQMQQVHRGMEARAVKRDRTTLIRQAYDTWRMVLRRKRREAETERFFQHLETRAARARDLYLMTKAFTHWAQLASEEVAKTSAARRHILGVKYFNAWREITAVNELKAQRFALRRPFREWKKKRLQIKDSEAEALAICDQNTKLKSFWHWFWCMCDRRAPQWYDFRLKRRSLLCWVQNLRTNQERNRELEVRNRQFDLGSVWEIWHRRSKAITSAEQQAETRDCQRLLKSNFDEWRAEARLDPIAVQVSDGVDERIKRSAYTQWATRIQMLKQARDMDHRRLLHDAWKTWNNSLRCQALNARIEERVKMETMYKWILAERSRLMQRKRDQRILRTIFSNFVTNIRGTYSQLLQRADVHEDYRTEELLRSKFDRWRDRLSTQCRQHYMAFEFYAPRLAEDSILIWRWKHDHVAKLEGWADDARFYFLMTKTLRHWNASRLESSKQRRQHAYAKTRRKIKINMASKALESWRSVTQHVTQLEQTAADYHEHKSVAIATDILGRWRARTEKQVQDCRDADIYYSRQIAYDQLIRWAEVFAELGDLETRATELYRLHVLDQAGAQFRKLSLRIFQIRSTVETADSMRVRTLRKHSRSMFRHWAEKAQFQLEARDSAGPVRPVEETADTSGSHGLFEPWYQDETPFKFSELAENPPGNTPMTTPGYMASPSKRAARARALAQLSTTPATPLQTPFATRLFRADTENIPPASTKPERSIRRSSLGTSVRFADEMPGSPSDGRQSASRRS